MKRKKIIAAVEAAIGVIIIVFFCLTLIDDGRIKELIRSNITRVIIDVLILIATIITSVNFIASVIGIFSDKNK